MHSLLSLFDPPAVVMDFIIEQFSEVALMLHNLL